MPYIDYHYYQVIASWGLLGGGGRCSSGLRYVLVTEDSISRGSVWLSSSSLTTPARQNWAGAEAGVVMTLLQRWWQHCDEDQARLL